MVWATGRAGGCQTCGTHISVTVWWIFSVRSSVELSRLVAVHCHKHLPICSIWTCKKLVKFATNWLQTLQNAHLWKHWMDLPNLKFHGLVLTCSCATYSHLPICPIWACLWAKNLSNQAALRSDYAEHISLKPLDGLYHSKFYGIV